MKKIVVLLLILTLIYPFPKSYSYCNENLMPIMGEGELDRENMYMYLLCYNDIAGLNPVNEEYAQKFVDAIIKYSKAEGVNHDVVFALIMHETGYLNFGGDVVAAQNNFGGLGTTGGGVKGAYFESMEDGILAIVQHLKCYASDEELVLECKDPRWNDELRKKAEYVEHLGYNDNPNGAGWAVPGDGYGQRLKNKIQETANIDKESAKILIAQREETLAASTTPEETNDNSAEEEPNEEIDTAKEIEKIILILLFSIVVVLSFLYIKLRRNLKRMHRIGRH